MKAISSLLSISFSFPSNTTSKSSSTKQNTNTTTSLPDIQLLALLIIAVKLYHPFPQASSSSSTTSKTAVQISPQSQTSLGTLGLNWHAYSKAKSQQMNTHPPRQPTELLTTEKDVMAMDDAQLDSYLDWYERTWIDDPTAEQEEEQSSRSRSRSRARAGKREMYAMFPTGRLTADSPRITKPQQQKPNPRQPLNQDNETSAAATAKKSSSQTRLSTILSTLEIRTPISDEDVAAILHNHHPTIIRPGQIYHQYRTETHLPPLARKFHAEAADLMGISTQTLLRGVRVLEVRLDRVRREGLGLKGDGEGVEVR
ncbi:hypothetical protein MMC09_003594 [Bachmanniomyces sp. S44760]|nr:hypothetical protein [Bachmanniomyces sp. S44760]